MTLLKVESFQQFYFPFFTEENTQLELLHTIHKGKEANHPNFRDSTFQTLKRAATAMQNGLHLYTSRFINGIF